jgi:hypothetical protein
MNVDILPSIARVKRNVSIFRSSLMIYVYRVASVLSGFATLNNSPGVIVTYIA